MFSYEKCFKDCYVYLNDGKLTIGNRRMERVWNMQEELPLPISMRNKQTGKEWYSEKENSQWIRQPEKNTLSSKKVLQKEECLFWM